MTFVDKNTNRNAAIEALRFFSILQIAIWHLGGYFINAGFLGVEFYFILAGFFLYKNATKPKASGVIVYSINKLSKFYFEYVVAFLFFLICVHKNFLSLFNADPVQPILRIVSELILLQGTGGFVDGMNYPLWFFSVLIYGGAIIYAAVRYYPKGSIRIVFPIMIVFFMAYCFNNGNSMALEERGVLGFIPFRMLRGMIEISYGVLAGYIFFNYKQFFVNNLRLLDILSVISLLFYFIIVALSGINASYVFIFIPIILMDAMTPGSWMNRLFKGKVWIWLGGISFSIFVLHASLVALSRHFLHVVLGMDLAVVLPIYLVCLIPVAYISHRTCLWLQAKLPIRIDFSPLLKKV